MSTYDLGDGVPVRYVARDPDGQLVSVSIALTVTHPDGSTTTPSMSATSLGVYDATVLVDSVGPWSATGVVSGAITDVFHDYWDVADPAPPLYASLDELKSQRRRKGDDTTSDEQFLKKLRTASRAIDDRCGYPARRFWLDRTATARKFRPRGRVTRDGVLLVDDIGSMDGLVVEVGSGSSWTLITDFEPYPDNALLTREPITGLQREMIGWPYWRGQRVRVTARWGWPVIPDKISEATLLLASRLYLRKDSPEGVIASGDWGALRLSRWDSDVESLIQRFILAGIA